MLKNRKCNHSDSDPGSETLSTTCQPIELLLHNNQFMLLTLLLHCTNLVIKTTDIVQVKYQQYYYICVYQVYNNIYNFINLKVNLHLRNAYSHGFQTRLKLSYVWQAPFPIDFFCICGFNVSRQITKEQLRQILCLLFHLESVSESRLYLAQA
ncbi:Hypothetical_protein [Hexamita inflata]|uniref:Hypothetical_protein n=1 Tax=Hexamita inflata TaxID=28002 RepID=A0AA86U154_9EUKA|nr:Hypothetical protein HINF_LOCUS14943 [Hexamita inflata]